MIQRELRLISPTFHRLTTASVIDQHAAHQSGCDSEEVSSILPMDATLIDQLHVDLVDERGRLKRVIVPFLAKVLPSEMMKLVVDERHELVERGTITSAPAIQEPRNVRSREFAHEVLRGASIRARRPILKNGWL